MKGKIVRTTCMISFFFFIKKLSEETLTLCKDIDRLKVRAKNKHREVLLASMATTIYTREMAKQKYRH